MPVSATPAFKPQSKDELNAAVDQCIQLSPIGDCSKGPHGSIVDWDVSAVTDMTAMFSDASTFNQDFSAWDVSAVTDMSYMFFHASAFNQDLSAWDVSAVTDMSGMFYNASTFNQDLSAWDVSAVTDMTRMFSYASAFNQDLSPWDVSAVTDMQNMFYGASAFQYKLCGAAWVHSKANKHGMFLASLGSISSSACATTTAGTVVGEIIVCLR